MRIISYNIMHGGQGRADPLAEVLEAQKPDVVALIEADDAQVLNRIASRLKFDVIGAAGRKHTVALLSRYPIIESCNYALIDSAYAGCLLETLVKIPNFGYLTIAIAQWGLFTGSLLTDSSLTENSPAQSSAPKSSSPTQTGRMARTDHAISEHDKRCLEHNINKLLGPLTSLKQARRPHIIISNFTDDRLRQCATPPSKTATPPSSPYPPSMTGQNNRADSPADKLSGEVVNDTLNSVVQSFTNTGYRDILSDAAISPDDAINAGSFSTQAPHWLPDRIFSFGLEPHRIAHTWIERDRLAKYASDHFPIGVEIKLG